MYRFGSLESMVISSTAGVCRYENLPECEYLFLIDAAGYSLTEFTTKVPDCGESVTVELVPESVVKGRLMDAITDQPVRGMSIGIEDTIKDCCFRAKDSGNTDENGEFEIVGIEKGRYLMKFPHIYSSICHFQMMIRHLIYNGYYKQEMLTRWNTDLTFYMAPETKIEPFRVEESQVLDLGEIPLFPVPRLNLEIVNEKQIPLAGFPFMMKIRRNNQTYDSCAFKTNENGKHTVPLIGFQKGDLVEIYVPEDYDYCYRLEDTQNSELPVHPNARILKPVPGQQLDVRMTYHPLEEDFFLDLVVRDKSTGKPVPEYMCVISRSTGFISGFFTMDETNLKRSIQNDQQDILLFQCRNDSGSISTGAIPLADDCSTWNQQSEEIMKIGIGIIAPGYVRQVFEIPLNNAFFGKILLLEIEPEAVVSGRLVLMGTDQSFTTETVKAFLSHTLPEDELVEYLRSIEESIEVIIVNETYEEIEKFHFMRHFENEYNTRVNQRGEFIFRNLRPHNKWFLHVCAYGFPQYLERNIDLKPGMNDLGDIPIGLPGRMEGFVCDENDKPVSGAVFQFPIDDYEYSKSEKRMTNELGAFSFQVADLTENRQIIRLIPPWGYSRNEQGRIETSIVWFDAIQDLDRNHRQEKNISIHRGNTLHIRIPATTTTLAMKEFYLSQENLYICSSGPSDKSQSEFGVRNIAVVGMDGEPGDFIYHHNRYFKDRRKPFTTQTMTLDLPNVPPGRYALRVDCSLFYDNKYRGGFLDSWGIPIVYEEFRMPDKEHTLVLQPASGRIEIGMKAIGNACDGRDLPAIAFTLDRETPLCTGLGSDLRMLFEDERVRMDDTLGGDRMISFVGYCGDFTDSSGFRGLPYDDIAFNSVPWGTYNLKLYILLEQRHSRRLPLLFEKKITISRENNDLRIISPFSEIPRPSEYEEPRPIICGNNGE